MILQDCGEGPLQEGKEVCSELRCPGSLHWSSRAKLPYIHLLLSFSILSLLLRTIVFHFAAAPQVHALYFASMEVTDRPFPIY